MSYLDEFQKKIDRDDFQGFLVLWEEYCEGDEVDGRELELVLSRLKASRFAGRFGPFAETALPLWERVEDADQAYQILALVVDLQTTNSQSLASTVYSTLEKRYSSDTYFGDKLRFVGLRNKETYQGALRNYELLSHLDEGRFVFHTGGWGTGEIVELSMVREEIAVEFECVAGRKTLSFDNSFRTLVPLTDDHFLARRFGDPDLLEEAARSEPVATIRMLLRDLGPKTAAEIKEELCELVIPADDWTRWWQSARSKVKKDTRIETPSTIRLPFRLRIEELTHLDRLKEVLAKGLTPEAVLLTIYNFLRDFPEIQRSEESRDFVRAKLHELIQGSLAPSPRLQAVSLLEELFGEEEGSLEKEIATLENLGETIDGIEIAAIKKRALVVVRQTRKDWQEFFLAFLFRVRQSALRDYLLKELQNQPNTDPLTERLESLLIKPTMQPQLFVWYFQKVMKKEEGGLYRDKEGQCQFFESFLMLLHALELESEYRELVKKMYGMLLADRYGMVRDLLKGSSEAFAKEFLLLVSKSHTLTPHDIKIMHSLVQVAHPSLVSAKSERETMRELMLWTTEEGFQKIRDRIQEIGTVEMIENAREIESAREHGDLRENAEFKAAQERRASLQAEIQLLSDQVSQARVITEADVSTDVIGVGSVVELSGDGKVQEYTLLGPWDADPDNGILSFQSRFAKAMIGLKAGESFTYQGREYTISAIASYFEHAAQ